jgi:hypothetical protein
VPACVSMVLAFQGFVVDERELCSILGTEPAGTPVWNLLELEERIPGSRVRLEDGSFGWLQQALNDAIAPVVIVGTRHLPHWTRETLHALVVVDLSAVEVLVNDPVLPSAPVSIPRAHFRLAWSEADFLGAIVEVRAGPVP